ncbi:hypothetical protein [Kitasatospora sp. NPDC056184]|uniref:hypothetical protein n=1 Tax=Kitasatospora sp. NPDC056184 TaxID=3345738 RepID=UPI0035D59B65
MTAAAVVAVAADTAARARAPAFPTARPAVDEGREQRSGTRIGAVVDGRPVPWPREEPERPDERRAAVGIEPFAAHTGRFAPRQRPDSAPVALRRRPGSTSARGAGRALRPPGRAPYD